MNLEKLLFFLVRWSPKNWMSRQFGKIALWKSPHWFVRPLMRWFASHYKMRLDEALLSFEEFENLDQLFTRELKPGLRPIEGDIVHPADSVIAQMGVIEGGRLLQAKGWTYSAAELLGSSEEAEKFIGGQFITYYLCPTDYHRVHSPIDGRLLRVRHIPGALWPVNPVSVNSVKNLFAVNERVVFLLQTAFGEVAVVMVGATNVGKISLSVGADWITNLEGVNRVREWTLPEPEGLSAGQELGQFHLGSTAIVLFPKSIGALKVTSDLAVLMGQTIRP